MGFLKNVAYTLLGAFIWSWWTPPRQSCPAIRRPPTTNHAAMARWLVHQNTWGVVSTASQHLGNGTAGPLPFGNAVSYSDGPRCQPTGRLLFFLTAMDATAQDLSANPNASLTVCEAQLREGCGRVDPQDPTCAKLTVTGRLEPVPPEGLAEAQRLLFARHPDMRRWPPGHQFQIYELHMSALRLLDWYGGAADIDPADYFAVRLTNPYSRATASKGHS